MSQPPPPINCPPIFSTHLYACSWIPNFFLIFVRHCVCIFEMDICAGIALQKKLLLNNKNKSIWLFISPPFLVGFQTQKLQNKRMQQYSFVDILIWHDISCTRNVFIHFPYFKSGSFLMCTCVALGKTTNYCSKNISKPKKQRFPPAKSSAGVVARNVESVFNEPDGAAVPTGI